MRKSCLLLLFLNLSSLNSSAQFERVTDSLLRSIKSGPDDTLKAFSLARLAYRLRDSNLDSAMLMANKAIELSQKLNFKAGLALAYRNMAVLNFRKGNYKVALDANYQAIKVYETLRDTGGMYSCYNGIANISSSQGNYKEALISYKKVMDRALRIKDTAGAALSCMNIANQYVLLKQNDKALENYYEAVRLQEIIGDKKALSLSYMNLAAVYYETRIYELGYSFYEKSLSVALVTNQKNVIAQSYAGMGEVLIAQKKYKKAAPLLNASLDLAIQMGQKDLIKNCYGSMAKLCENLGDYQGAFKNLELYNQYKDSLINENSIRQVASMQAEFETENKQKEIEVLTKSQQLQETQLDNQQNLIYAGGAGLLIVLVFSAFLYKNYSEKKKINKMLGEQNKIIFQKQTEITDSILYAKKIQDAVFPETYSVIDLFPFGGFGFAMPKNVVSGDFYWFARSEEKSLIAAADCTGHGVPGAFMSIIAITMLNQAIQKDKLINPSDILSSVNRNIKKALKQNNEQNVSRDGLDIALCVVDFKNKVLEYSGANRPLYFYRDGVFNEYKATKAAIAGFTTDEQRFVTETISFQRGDRFYIFSDGFTDQFGGPKEKKVTSKRFKEFLNSIQGSDMQVQEKRIEEFFANWKGEAEQTDDVLIIGIQL